MDITKLQSIMNGDFLRSKAIKQQYKLIGLIAGLLFVYILAGYHSISQQKHLADLRKEVKDKKFEYLTISAERVDKTKQSQIAIELQERGSQLQSNRKAAIRLRP